MFSASKDLSCKGLESAPSVCARALINVFVFYFPRYDRMSSFTSVPRYVHMSRDMSTCPAICPHVPRYVHMSRDMSTCPAICSHFPQYVHMSRDMFTFSAICTHDRDNYVHIFHNMFTCPAICSHFPQYIHMTAIIMFTSLAIC